MTTPEQNPVPTPPAAPPNRRRWKKVLLIAGGVLGGLILFVLLAGPFIIGAVAKSKIASSLEEQLQAKVDVGSVSFRWSGRIQLNDFRLVPKNFADPLVEVKKVDAKVRLGSAIGGSYIADVEVVAPKILVEKGADGKFNYDFPPQPPKESKRKKAGEKDADAKPFVQATVKVRDGEVRIRGQGRETVYRNLAVDAKVDTLDKPISYAVALDTVKVNGGFDMSTMSGTATLTLDRFSLKNATGAARAYSQIVELDGTVRGTLDYQIKGAPRFAGKGRLEIDGFRMDETVLDRLTLTHDGSIDDKGSGRHVMAISAGKAIDATIALDVTDAFGARIVKTDLRGDFDLAALAGVLRGQLPKGMALSGGVSVRGTCESKGPTQADLDAGKPRVGAKVDVLVSGTQLELVKDGKPTKLDAVQVRHAGTLDENGVGKNTFTIDVGKALSVRAQVDVTDALGKTPAVTADLTGSSDLGALGAMFERLIGLKPDKALEGSATLKGKVEAMGAGSAKAELGVALSNVVAVDVKTKKRYDIDHAVEFTLKGGWDRKTKTAMADAIRLTSSFATMDGKGGAVLGGETPEIKESAFKLNVDLEKLGGKLALFMEEPPVLSGTLAAAASTAGDRYDLGASLKGLRIGTTGPVDVPEIKATGVLSLKPRRVAATVKAPAFEWTATGIALKGSLESQATYTDEGISGTTKILNLVLDEVKDPGLTIVHEIGLVDKTIELKKVEVASSFLRGSVTGKILRLDPALEFQKVHLAFKYLPTKLGAIAKPWLPGKLEGTEEKTLDITLDGKASSSKVLAVLRGATGSIDLDLATFTMDGLSITGRTHFSLKDGNLVSSTPLSVNKGKTDLHAVLDFGAAEEEPQSKLTFNAKGVDANGQMGPLLERINPIFNTSGVDAKVDGRIQSEFQLVWSGPIDPDEKDWTAAASRSLSGSGVFSVQELNILGSPAVGQIMSAIGQDNAMKGEVIATTIRVANGRCEYENMLIRGSRKDAAAFQRDQEQLAADRAQLEADKPRLSGREFQKRLDEFKQREEDLPFRYTLKFTGWVGFDKRMQLRVLMPMTQNMIKSHPNLQKYIGTSFWVDLTGTTERPRLDVGKMIAEAVKRAAEGVLMDKLDDALKRLLDKKKKDEKK